MPGRYSLAFTRVAIVFVALAGFVLPTRSEGVSLEASAELRRFARLAAENPGPWRQVPGSVVPGALSGSASAQAGSLAAPLASPGPSHDALAIRATGPDLWQPGFGLPSLNEYPSVAIEFRGDLVVAGWLRSAGGVKVNGIARWDGSGWRPLGAGIVPAFALAVHRDRLVAGSWTGEVSSWDGTAWTALARPPMDRLDALFEHRDTLYAAGTRYPEVGVVARFDGAAWTALGGSFDGPAMRLGVFRDRLIVGGRFESCAGVPCRYVARWDGERWSALGAGIDATPYGTVQAIQEFDDRLIVGGSFESCSGEPTRGIASFDGESWHALPGEPVAIVYDLMVADRRLWVAGYVYGPGCYSSVKAFDGSAWDTSVEPLSPWALGLATWGGRVVAAGGFDQAGTCDRSRPLTNLAVLGAAGWEGFENWTGEHHGLAINAGAAWAQSVVEFRGDLVVSGMLRLAGTGTGWKPLAGIARWDGLGWDSLGDQIICSMGHVGVVGDDLVLAGNVSGMSDEGPLVGAARWDGSTWHPMGQFWSGIVEAVCAYDGFVYVGGEGIRLPSGATTTLARWDGSAWNAMPGAPTGADYNTARVRTLGIVGGRLLVGGSFNTAGGMPCGGVAEWDGASWRTLGAGPGGDVEALAVHDDVLYAGGLLSGAHPYELEGLKRWTGQAWAGLGLVNTQVTALASYDGRLVIGGLAGTDRFAPGSPGLVAFDGERWSGFGSGLAGMPSSICQWGGDLVVAGNFDHAGGAAAYSIARWAGGAPPPATEPASGVSLAATLTSANETTVRYHLPRAGRVRIEAYDLAGARIATLFDGASSAGDRQFAWRDGSPVPLPRQGIYFLRLRFENLETVSKLVIAR